MILLERLFDIGPIRVPTVPDEPPFALSDLEYTLRTFLRQKCPCGSKEFTVLSAAVQGPHL